MGAVPHPWARCRRVRSRRGAVRSRRPDVVPQTRVAGQSLDGLPEPRPVRPDPGILRAPNAWGAWGADRPGIPVPGLRRECAGIPGRERRPDADRKLVGRAGSRCPLQPAFLEQQLRQPESPAPCTPAAAPSAASLHAAQVVRELPVLRVLESLPKASLPRRQRLQASPQPAVRPPRAELRQAL